MNGADDLVARLHPGDSGPDLFDDAGALVAPDEREPGDDVAVS